ncbi:MAG: PQQ-binding-like beta-propeller repeat protein [Planctomycetota bacterium]
MIRTSHGVFIRRAVVSVWAWLALPLLSHAAITPQEIIQASGIDHGLCVIIGCGDEDSPALAAALAASGRMLVHGIALDNASVGRARTAISVAGVHGLATVERLPIKPLPYRDNLVNLLVVSGEWKVESEEIMRVLAPNGVAIFFNPKSKIQNPKLVKPMPKEMDEWTHEAHGPDGNCVSKDTVVRLPLGFRWHAGLPMNICNRKQAANAWSSTRGIALAGGRCFTISSSVMENLGPAYFAVHGLDQYVTARDAFNGLFLWRTRIGATYYGGLVYENRAPFAAVGDRVYAASEDGKLVALDTATGKAARTFETAYAPGKILIDGNVVVSAGWKDGTNVGGWQGVDRRRMDFGVGEGAVEAFDVQTGNRLWKIDKLATSIRSADGILFMVQRTGPDKHEEMTYPPPKGEDAKKPLPPRPGQAVAAVDLRTGKPLWEVPSEKFAVGSNLSVDAAGLGIVTVSHDNGIQTSAFSAMDGKLLFTEKANSYTAFYNGEMLLGPKKYDPKTGQSTGPAPFQLSRTICTPRYFANNIIVSNRMGALIVDGKQVEYGGARGGCLFASIPAYGAFYTPQNWCRCAPAQIPGFITFGPIAVEPSPTEMEKPPAVESGSAFGQIQNPKSQIQNDTDWPMYRHGPERNNATPAAAPEKLDVLWRARLADQAPDGPIGLDWKDFLNSPVTAPVVAEGIVVAAAMDRNQVVALDAAAGRELWRCAVGARIDTPPTLHQGLCIFGAHDGYVYALSCKEGRLAWRMRAAPREERMASYGKIESPWPVVGTVLVADGMGYASAGHTQGSDGGIVVRAFDPMTGKAAWSRAIPPSPGKYRQMRRNDLIFKTGDSVQLMVTRMDPKTGEVRKNPTFEYGQFLDRQAHAKARKKEFKETMTVEEIAPSIGLEGFTSWNWTRLGNRKHMTMNFGNVGGDMASWDDGMVCAIAKEGTTVTAVKRENVGPFGQKVGPPAWTLTLPAGRQATSLVLCPNAVLVGGGVYEAGSNEGRGFVMTLSRDKGEKIAECAFGAPLSYNGLAVAGGRLYATLADGSAVCLGSKAAQPK